MKNCLACIALFFFTLPLGSMYAHDLTISSITWKDFHLTKEELSCHVQGMQSQEGGKFDPVLMDKDIKALAPVFESLVPEFFIDGEKVNVVFKGKLRPFIRAIQWRVSGSLDQFSKEEFQKLFPLKEGDRFDKNKVLWESRKAAKWLQSRGYADVKIELEEDRFSEEAMDLLVRIKLGTLHYIRAIKIVGLEEYYENLFERIRLTQRYDPFSAFLFHSGFYDERRVEQDRFNLLSLLKNAGYSDAQVEACPLRDLRSGAVTLVFRVDQGERYSIRKITLPSEDPFNINALMKSYGLFPGTVFSLERIFLASEAIEALYGTNGYIECLVKIEQTLASEHENIFDLNICVDAGDKLRIGRISILGNLLTDPSFLMGQCPFAPLDYFDSSVMKSFENTLMQTGLFEKVRVYASNEPFEGDPLLRELIIDLQEQPTGNLSLAFTYGSESSWKGTVEVRDRHFNIMGLFDFFTKGVSAFRGQGETIGLQVSAGQRFVDMQGDFFRPFIFRSRWGYGFDFTLQKSIAPSDNIKVTRKSLSNKLTRELGPFTDLLIRHRLGSVQSFVETSDEIEVPDQIKEEIESDFFLQGFGLGFSWDKTLGCGFYLSGWRVSVLSEILSTSTKALDSHIAGKLQVKGVLYLPFMKGRLKLSCCSSGLTLMRGSFDDFPYPERLFTDQETTPRGWKERSLGPKLADDNGITTSYPKGGDRLFAYSSEYNVPLNRELALFAFSDFAYLSLGSSATTPQRVGQLQTSVGYGIRIRSFMGMPLSVGFGYPLVHSDQTNDLSNFFFSLGNSF
ncbi:BamA/OMP85 family outer membrane protein [Candidatus Similichlamydia laticola]|uniref:BamA/OMP85 family outer membrane protein n=1 Tax=Candidatus Similichlamydia laticola TaxID=2170265 RepID=UPI001C6A76E6|nr:POTRA domain-containing protein [Candidatus Similichlamydia laticola]